MFLVFIFTSRLSFGGIFFLLLFLSPILSLVKYVCFFYRRFHTHTLTNLNKFVSFFFLLSCLARLIRSFVSLLLYCWKWMMMVFFGLKKKITKNNLSSCFLFSLSIFFFFFRFVLSVCAIFLLLLQISITLKMALLVSPKNAKTTHQRKMSFFILNTLEKVKIKTGYGYEFDDDDDGGKDIQYRCMYYRYIKTRTSIFASAQNRRRRCKFRKKKFFFSPKIDFFLGKCI